MTVTLGAKIHTRFSLMQTTLRNAGHTTAPKDRRNASLSVVVVASGSPGAVADATKTLRSASADLPAQLIVVSESGNASLAASLERSGAEFISAPSGTSRAQMCDLGMSRARGTIVVVRDADAIGDAGWLDSYRRVLPKRELPVAESIVMESMAARHSAIADG